MSNPIYLDYNATTPHDPEVIEAMRPFLEHEFGNPSSSHWYGIAPRKAVENARAQVAELLGCKPHEVVFTSGGTESNNYAIIGTAMAKRDQGNHIITSQIEHPAVLEVCRFLEGLGFRVTYLPVDEYGLVSVRDVADAVSSDTILITVMHANNEVGTIQPIREISEVAAARGVTFHTDAAQSLGKIPADVRTLGVDLLTVAGHKLYAPKGLGALYVREGLVLHALMFGAGQENGKRPGTENVMEIVGLGKACEIAGRSLERNMLHMQQTRDRLYEGLANAGGELKLNGHPDLRLPNTLSISFRNLAAQTLLEEIGLEVAASAGAACHSDRVEVSHVLRAMGVDMGWAKGTVRFSTGRMTSTEEIDRAVRTISSAAGRLSAQ